MAADKNYGPAGERPYQCFMGQWEGLCKTFSPGGDYLEATPVHMDVYWLDDHTWHLHEHFENLYEAGETTFDTPSRSTGAGVSRRARWSTSRAPS